jgi:hypothetical protein
MRPAALLVAALALAVAGCGSSRRACTSPAQTRALARLQKDVAALKRAAALPVRDSLRGNAAVNRATDRFLQDVLTAPIDPLVRNRMIDHAAAVLLGSCQQCFQALEAERPIPQIKQTHTTSVCPAS